MYIHCLPEYSSHDDRSSVQSCHDIPTGRLGPYHILLRTKSPSQLEISPSPSTLESSIECVRYLIYLICNGFPIKLSTYNMCPSIPYVSQNVRQKLATESKFCMWKSLYASCKKIILGFCPLLFVWLPDCMVLSFVRKICNIHVQDFEQDFFLILSLTHQVFGSLRCTAGQRSRQNEQV